MVDRWHLLTGLSRAGSPQCRVPPVECQFLAQLVIRSPFEEVHVEVALCSLSHRVQSRVKLHRVLTRFCGVGYHSTIRKMKTAICLCCAVECSGLKKKELGAFISAGHVKWDHTSAPLTLSPRYDPSSSFFCCNVRNEQGPCVTVSLNWRQVITLSRVLMVCFTLVLVLAVCCWQKHLIVGFPSSHRCLRFSQSAFLVSQCFKKSTNCSQEPVSCSNTVLKCQKDGLFEKGDNYFHRS